MILAVSYGVGQFARKSRQDIVYPLASYSGLPSRTYCRGVYRLLVLSETRGASVNPGLTLDQGAAVFTPLSALLKPFLTPQPTVAGASSLASIVTHAVRLRYAATQLAHRYDLTVKP